MNNNHLYIHRDVLKSNIEKIVSIIGSKSKLSAVVKANGYGIDLLTISKLLIELGVEKFCVAKPGEAIFLRKAGLNQQILVLGHTEKENVIECVRNNIILTIHDENSLQEILEVSKNSGLTPKVHIKYNTGMNRIGFNSEDRIIEIISESRYNSYLNIHGLFSHLSRIYDGDETFTENQILKFDSLVKKLEDMDIRPECVHLLASGGILLKPEYSYDMVRAGCILYGLLPDKEILKNYKFDEVTSLVTKIIQINDLNKGDSVGYGNSYIVSKRSKIATLSIGYGDGYPRRMSNKGIVVINGETYPIVGCISMDMCAIDISGNDDINVGDEVALIGSNIDSRIAINEIANIVDTVRTEILINISNRVERQII